MQAAAFSRLRRGKSFFLSHTASRLFYSLWHLFPVIARLPIPCLFLPHRKKSRQPLIDADALIIQIAEIQYLIVRMIDMGFHTELKILKGAEDAFSRAVDDRSDFPAENLSGGTGSIHAFFFSAVFAG